MIGLFLLSKVYLYNCLITIKESKTKQKTIEVSQQPVQDVAPPAYDEVPSELESDEEFHGFGDDEIARAKDRRQKISDHDS